MEALVAFRRAWNIARSGRNIQFWEDNKAATLSMSISEMGWATFRGGSSLHDENEVKRRKPRWLSARPPMSRSSSFSSEFNKNPRASRIELAARRCAPSLCRGTLCVSTLSSVHRPSILFRLTFPSSRFLSFRASLSLLFSPLFTTSHFVKDVSSVSSNSQTNCVAEWCLGRLFRGDWNICYKYWVIQRTIHLFNRSIACRYAEIELNFIQANLIQEYYVCLCFLCNIHAR